ncbi:MAG: CapA family protein [Eubacteriales bacterium]
MDIGMMKQETAGFTPETQQRQEEDHAHVLILGGVETPASSFAAGEALSSELAGQDLRISALQTGDASAAIWLMQAGVELISLAGLQSEGKDASAIGFIGATTIGAGETESMANRPYVCCINGIRIGVVSFAEQVDAGFHDRADILSLSAYDRVRMLLNQCDHVIVLVQSGLAESELPLPEWRERYHCFVDAGASLVVDLGRARGWEKYKHGLVFYGLGSPAGADSLGLFVNLRRNGKFSYEARALQNTAGSLDFSQNSAFRTQIDAQNTLLLNKKEYISAANDMCTRLYCANESTQKRGIKGLFSQQTDGDQRLLSLLENESLRLVAKRALRLRSTEEKGKR